jgi:hypothetical protein
VAERYPTPCTEWTGPNDAGWLRYAIYPLCFESDPWEKIDKHLRFKVLDVDGNVVAEEGIPYTIERDGFFVYMDAIWPAASGRDAPSPPRRHLPGGLDGLAGGLLQAEVGSGDAVVEGGQASPRCEAVVQFSRSSLVVTIMVWMNSGTGPWARGSTAWRFSRFSCGVRPAVRPIGAPT